MSQHRATPDAPSIVVIGDTVADVDVVGTVRRRTPDADAPILDDVTQRQRPGGAGLVATLAAGFGADVTLVTAIGSDATGAALRDELEGLGVRLIDLGFAATAGPALTPTKVRIGTHANWFARVDLACSAVTPIGPWSDAATDAIGCADAAIVSCYGRGVADALLSHTGAAHARTSLSDGRPVVWDPHPDGPVPAPWSTIATPNEREARLALARATTEGSGFVERLALARSASQAWGLDVALTVGADGALLARRDGPPIACRPDHVASGDPCGAGDAFAAALAIELTRHPIAAALRKAVDAATAHVAGGAVAPLVGTGSMSRPGRRAAKRMVEQAHARGETVVVAGGCFDVLHAGHVELLRAAASLGDVLVVAINSDSSVRRLKGPTRPVVTASDRAAVLAGVHGVDAVVVFDEDDPCDVLVDLRPDVFVKGADYADAPLPEAAVMAPWGGEVAVIPLLPDRSSTRVISAVRALAS
jgi:D-beta-D-heptose 7-phosphate kinase / D-beta-D-heptose 1-phosphate adenosyltransferase